MKGLFERRCTITINPPTNEHDSRLVKRTLYLYNTKRVI